MDNGVLWIADKYSGKWYIIVAKYLFFKVSIFYSSFK